jgi:hypothetical protein
MKNSNKPGRVKLNCTICSKQFSTHSSNRSKCHSCLPKCTQIHLFNQDGVKRAKLTDAAIEAIKRIENKEEL